MNFLDATYCVADVETTGVEADDAVCQVAFVTTTATQVLCLQHTLLNPLRPITAKPRSIHHISDDDVRDAPTWPNLPFKLPGRNAFAAHFAEFDSRYLPELAKRPWLCTCRLAKRVYPELEGYSNQFLRYELGLNVPPLPPDVSLADTMPHRAPADAWVTAHLLQHLLHNLPPEAPRELWNLSTG